MIFGFCANGKLLTMSLWSAANDFSREHSSRASELQQTRDCGNARCLLEIARHSR
jgi:hypothetical protein